MLRQGANTSVCACARLGPAALGLSPGSVLAVKMLLAENFYLLLNSQSSLTVKKNEEKKKVFSAPFCLSFWKQVHFYELHVLCFAGLVALHSTAQMPLRQWKDQNSVSALIFTGLTSVWIIALLSAALLLICISIRKIRAWPSVFKAS